MIEQLTCVGLGSVVSQARRINSIDPRPQQKSQEGRSQQEEAQERRRRRARNLSVVGRTNISTGWR
jgi:hypothetical protein